MSLLGAVEAYLYGSGVDTWLAATSEITISETVGPLSYKAILPSPMRLTDALAQWQALFTASALNNKYSLSYDSTTQRVTIARTAGVSTFTVTLSGNLKGALGFASASLTPAGTTFTGAVQPLARFDGLRIGVAPVEEGGKVDLTTYRHGRVQVLAFGNHDVHRVTFYVTKDVGGLLAESYCIAGRLRIWQDSTLVAAWSYAYPQGYLDGYVLGVSSLESMGQAEQWYRIRLLLAVPR